MRIRNMNDCIMGMTLLLISVFLYSETYAFREVFSFSFGPRVFPRIILGITGLCSLVLVLQSISLGGSAVVKKQTEPRQWDVAVMAMRAGMVGLLALYIATLPLVGYLPDTIAFLFLTMLLLGVRKPKSLAIYAVVSVIVAVTLQYIFGTLLKFFLP